MIGEHGSDWQSYQPDWGAYCSQLLARITEPHRITGKALPRSDTERWIPSIPPGTAPRPAGKLIAEFLLRCPPDGQTPNATSTQNPKAALIRAYRLDREARLGSVLKTAHCDRTLELIRDTSYWGLDGERHVRRLVSQGVPFEPAYEVVRLYQLWWGEMLPARFHPQVRLRGFDDLKREQGRGQFAETGDQSHSEEWELSRYSDWQTYQPDWQAYCSQLVGGLTGKVFREPGRVPPAEVEPFVARLPPGTTPATASEAITALLIPYYPYGDGFSEYEVYGQARSIDGVARLASVLAASGREDAGKLITTYGFWSMNGDRYVKRLVRRGVSLETAHEVARLHQLERMDEYAPGEGTKQIRLRSLEELRREHAGRWWLPRLQGRNRA